MPLNVRTSGSQIIPAFFNDIRDLLTGNITDQLITYIGNMQVRSRAAAAAAPTAVVVAGGSVDIGAHTYYITFYDSTSGETVPTNGVVATTASTNKQVNLSNIPTGPAGTVGRRVYRTKVGGTTPFFVVSIADNTTTTYSDTVADSTLSTGGPSHPSFGDFKVADNTGTTKIHLYTDGAADYSSSVSATGFVGLGFTPAKIAVNDSNSTRSGVTIYEGTTDPSTYTTPNEGDLWINA